MSAPAVAIGDMIVFNAPTRSGPTRRTCRVRAIDGEGRPLVNAHGHKDFIVRLSEIVEVRRNHEARARAAGFVPIDLSGTEHYVHRDHYEAAAGGDWSQVVDTWEDACAALADLPHFHL